MDGFLGKWQLDVEKSQSLLPMLKALEVSEAQLALYQRPTHTPQLQEITFSSSSLVIHNQSNLGVNTLTLEPNSSSSSSSYYVFDRDECVLTLFQTLSTTGEVRTDQRRLFGDTMEQRLEYRSVVCVRVWTRPTTVASVVVVPLQQVVKKTESSDVQWMYVLALVGFAAVLQQSVVDLVLCFILGGILRFQQYELKKHEFLLCVMLFGIRSHYYFSSSSDVLSVAFAFTVWAVQLARNPAMAAPKKFKWTDSTMLLFASTLVFGDFGGFLLALVYGAVRIHHHYQEQQQQQEDVVGDLPVSRLNEETASLALTAATQALFFHTASTTSTTTKTTKSWVEPITSSLQQLVNEVSRNRRTLWDPSFVDHLDISSNQKQIFHVDAHKAYSSTRVLYSSKVEEDRAWYVETSLLENGSRGKTIAVQGFVVELNPDQGTVLVKAVIGG